MPVCAPLPVSVVFENRAGRELRLEYGIGTRMLAPAARVELLYAGRSYRADDAAGEVPDLPRDEFSAVHVELR